MKTVTLLIIAYIIICGYVLFKVSVDKSEEFEKEPTVSKPVTKLQPGEYELFKADIFTERANEAASYGDVIEQTRMLDSARLYLDIWADRTPQNEGL